MEKKATTVELILLPYLMLQCDIVCLHSLTTMLWLLSSNDSIPPSYPLALELGWFIVMASLLYIFYIRLYSQGMRMGPLYTVRN